MKRGFKHGSAMAIYITLVVLTLMVVNSISFVHYRLFDMTEEGMFTLSSQTIKIIGSLKEKVKIYAFVRPMRDQEIADVLDQYAYESSDVSYEIMDPDKKPALADKYGVREYGTFVVETDSGRRESTKKFTEEQITNLIIKAVTSKQKKIYILTGHEERSLTDSKPLGWSGAKKALEAANYAVKTLNWFDTGQIPDDADLLIIPGPRNDFQQAEVDRVGEYMDAGRKIMFTLDPSILPNIAKLLGLYGFQFYEDMIVDPLSQRIGFDPLVASVSSYPSHPVVKDFKAATFFPVARSLGLQFSNSKEAEVKPIGQTTAQSWSETDIKSVDMGAPVFSEESDMAGPRIVAASAQWETGPPMEERKIGEKARKARMIVTGDSDFASNSTIGLSANRDLFLNMIAWLLEEDTRISIRPKSRGFNPIFFTAAQLTGVFWVVVVILPALVAIVGLAVTLRRRKS